MADRTPSPPTGPSAVRKRSGLVRAHHEAGATTSASSRSGDTFARQVEHLRMLAPVLTG